MKFRLEFIRFSLKTVFPRNKNFKLGIHLNLFQSRSRQHVRWSEWSNLNWVECCWNISKYMFSANSRETFAFSVPTMISIWVRTTVLTVWIFSMPTREAPRPTRELLSLVSLIARSWIFAPENENVVFIFVSEFKWDVWYLKEWDRSNKIVKLRFVFMLVSFVSSL